MVEDYLAKVPFKFTGELEKVVIELGKSGPTASDDKQIQESNRSSRKSGTDRDRMTN